MRTSNLRGRRSARIAAHAALICVLVVASGCGSNAASPSPTPVPTAAPTPDPHLTEPASVDVIYVELQKAGLDITANTASTGPGGEPVKRISATFNGWPLILSGYTSAAALRTSAGFDPAQPVGQGDPPITIAGLNILVEFGPTTSNTALPEPPDASRRAAALQLVEVLDPLLGPLAQVSVEALPLPTGTGGPSPSAAESLSPSPS
jgi:hypothetical protein